ncbi:hypothetical protein JTB14_015994 [Gonioctena quinquepunctata]|nr:hypothetical protein JTB14_015994 [Gonioctena quinquepunctata]
MEVPSEKRKDGKWATLRGKTSVRVHDKCRKTYTNEPTILAHIKRQEEFVETHKPRETRSAVPDFAFRTNCFICGLPITKQFLAAEATDLRNVVYQVRDITGGLRESVKKDPLDRD